MHEAVPASRSSPSRTSRRAPAWGPPERSPWGYSERSTPTSGSRYSPRSWRREACHIEIDRLGEPVGKQDQYIAAYGGLTAFGFHPDDTVTVEPLAMTDSSLRELEDHLLLFFTGYSREASRMLSDQHSRSAAGDAQMLDGLDRTKQLGLQIRAALESGQLTRFGELMHEHWLAKRGPHRRDVEPGHRPLVRAGATHGAVGGKVVGAGAGGFLLFLADDPARLRRAMADQGLNEVRFRFDHLGSEVLTVG